VAESNSLADAEIMLKIAGYDSRALEQLYRPVCTFSIYIIKKIVTIRKPRKKFFRCVRNLFGDKLINLTSKQIISIPGWLRPGT